MSERAGTGKDSGDELADVRRELQALADPEVGAFLQGFFRTGPGEYGEGDRFLGVRVPRLRSLARSHRGLAVEDALELLRSPWHEERLLALIILVDRHRRGGEAQRETIFRAYLDNTRHVDNWDLVDASAPGIVGGHLDPDEAGTVATLETLARSDDLWERRIAILATFPWIKADVFGPTLRIAEVLVQDPHDLIHKAVGWMLREVGKRDQGVEEAFLREHYRGMPRTMLRYAIERFPETLRVAYLRGEV